MFLKWEPSAVYHVDNKRWFTLVKGSGVFQSGRVVQLTPHALFIFRRIITHSA